MMWFKFKQHLSHLFFLDRKDNDDEALLPQPRNKRRSSSSSNLSFREEYMHALRTESFVEILNQVQNKHNKFRKRSFSVKPQNSNSDYTSILEPKQDVLNSIVHDSTCNFPSILLDYFNTTTEACDFCGSIMDSIVRARSNHYNLQRALNINKQLKGSYPSAVIELQHFSRVQNPFEGNSPVHFARIRDSSAPMVKQLVSAHKKVITMRQHHGASCGFLERENAQLDAAARGAFTLDRDFDTMSRMVSRLWNEIEHGKNMIRLYMDDEVDEEWIVREVVRELQARDGWLINQLEELEEHVCLCFLNINRARRIVVQEVLYHRKLG